MFGPFLFILFQNDLALLLEHICDIYYHADSNTVANCANDADILCKSIENAKQIIIIFVIGSK